MGELEERINEIKESNFNSDIPPNVIHSLSDIIMEGAPSTVIELLSQQVEELSQVVCTEQFITDDLRHELSELQERFNTSIQQSGASSLRPTSDPSIHSSDRERDKMRSSQREVQSREREIARKGIERLEKQILQHINVYIPKDQNYIAL